MNNHQLVPPRTSVLGFWQAIGLVLLASLLVTFLDSALKGTVGREKYYLTWPLATITSLSIVILISHRIRPELLRLSHWTPTPADVAVGLAFGSADYGLTRLIERFQPGPLTIDNGHPEILSVLCIVFLGPILEEILCRAFVLRSLVEHTRPLFAVLITGALVASAHESFLLALPGQLGLSAVYVIRKKSMSAAISYHMLANALGYLTLFHSSQLSPIR
jgi:membrane protease YdiL (CAAX protease family)